jgi:phosphatidylethanolamine-binding protein (PEBP) family uncharacterized protein
VRRLLVVLFDPCRHLPPSTTKKELENAMEGHILQLAKLMRKYRRK